MVCCIQSLPVSYYDVLASCGFILQVSGGSLDGAGLVTTLYGLQVILAELEAAGLILRHVGKVEADTDEIALSGVVALIVVIVDNHLVTIILSSCHVLEVVKVERVSKDIVRVDALECLA